MLGGDLSHAARHDEEDHTIALIGGQMMPHALALVSSPKTMRMGGHAAMGHGWNGLHPIMTAAELLAASLVLDLLTLLSVRILCFRGSGSMGLMAQLWWVLTPPHHLWGAVWPSTFQAASAVTSWGMGSV